MLENLCVIKKDEKNKVIQNPEFDDYALNVVIGYETSKYNELALKTESKLYTFLGDLKRTISMIYNQDGKYIEASWEYDDEKEISYYEYNEDGLEVKNGNWKNLKNKEEFLKYWSAFKKKHNISEETDIFNDSFNIFDYESHDSDKYFDDKFALESTTQYSEFFYDDKKRKTKILYYNEFGEVSSVLENNYESDTEYTTTYKLANGEIQWICKTIENGEFEETEIEYDTSMNVLSKKTTWYTGDVDNKEKVRTVVEKDCLITETLYDEDCGCVKDITVRELNGEVIFRYKLNFTPNSNKMPNVEISGNCKLKNVKPSIKDNGKSQLSSKNSEDKNFIVKIFESIFKGKEKSLPYTFDESEKAIILENYVYSELYNEISSYKAERYYNGVCLPMKISLSAIKKAEYKSWNKTLNIVLSNEMQANLPVSSKMLRALKKYITLR